MNSVGATMSHSKGLKIGVTGFLVAVVGAIFGFGGFQFNVQWLSIIGFAIVGMGVVVGFVGILYGWLTEGRHALSGSVDAAKELTKGKADRF